MKEQSGDGLVLSPDDRLRLTNAVRYIAGLSKFLLWCNALPAGAVMFYANGKGSASVRVVQIDASVSSRFAIAASAIDGDATVFFGAQSHEMIWLSIIPWSAIAFDGNSLFFMYEPTGVMGMAPAPSLCVAVAVPHADAKRVIKKSDTLRFFEIYQSELGAVKDSGGVLREVHPIKRVDDILKYLAQVQIEKQQKTKATTALL
jgi:hypothetical protein